VTDLKMQQSSHPSEGEHPLATLAASPDSVRLEVVHNIHAALAAPAAEKALPFKETPFVVPGDNAPHTTPPLLVGSIWRQLNGLRILRQYTLTLSRMCREYAFLRGHSITCVYGLEWFSNLNKPMASLDQGVRSSLEATLRQAVDSRQNDSRERIAYEVHAQLPCPDRDMLRLTVQMNFPSATEYEVDVCRHMILVEKLPFDEWRARFPRWRSHGLYYPMAVAARRMASPSQWLPPLLAAVPTAQTFFAALRSFAEPQRPEHAQALEALVDAWEKDRTGAAHALAATLDRLAVLMRIKSNGTQGDPLDFDLDKALAAFPDYNALDFYDGNFAAWYTLKRAAEDTFPPCTLCAPLARPRRSTWGLTRLTLELLPGNVLRFKERVLGLVPGTHDMQPKQAPSLHTIEEHAEAEGPPQPLAAGSVDPEWPAHGPMFGNCLASQTWSRVQDVLWRLGELLLSPEMGLCMLYPTVAMHSLQGAQDPCCQRFADYCSNRQHLMGCMVLTDVSTSQVAKQHFARYVARLETCLPPVHSQHFDRPAEVLLWRVDIPPRLLMYVGEPTDVHPAAVSRHGAHKVLLNGKASTRTVSSLAFLERPLSAPERLCTPDDVRASLRSYGMRHLLDHPGNFVFVKGHGPAVSTSLAESIGSFALGPGPPPTVRTLGQPPPRWGGESIDERYAERQDAPNGFRFRDWVALHSTPIGTHQSRLAAHVVRFDRLYYTKLPWIDDDERVRWVRMASTAPPENRTLHGHNLRHAIETRFMHDLRTLPVRAPGDTVLRANADIYSSAPDTVAIAYAPTGDRPSQVELAVFQCQFPEAFPTK
jgi:hypothetical protein